ncbi:DUF2817 domain-containing protein [Candidatus Woesearchaeota archaeon]|nr:MAG: DUF2817 domain-containing protein [Candidatus Woesearchaeota archaeon]
MINEYFSESYYEAREKFLKATKSMELVTCNGTDVALLEAKNKKNLAIIVSGVHGVEGYTGSAIQNMFARHIINKNCSWLFIHALNSYGFKNNRRFNKNNVDLNRAFYDAPVETKCNNLEKYLLPKRPRWYDNIEDAVFYMNSIRVLLKSIFNLPRLVNDVAGGQYQNKEGLYYGGNEVQDEVKLYKKILYEYTIGYENLYLIDIHTGLGLWGKLFAVTEHKKGSEEFNQLQRILPMLKSDACDEQYKTNASIESFTKKHSKTKKTVTATIEFGTYSKFSEIVSALCLLNLLIAENQATFYGSVRGVMHHRERLKQGFYPNDEKWRMMVLKQSYEFGKKFGEMVE